MDRLTYMLNVSLDGFIESRDHELDWSSGDDELLAWFAERASGLGGSLYGRRLYELMSAHWPFPHADPTATDAAREFSRQWLRIPKVVFSSTLTSVDWNSRLVSGDVGALYAELRTELDGDVEVAGPTLASQFIRRGLVDRYEMMIHPVILGGGTPYLPPLDAPIRLRLTDTRTVGSGVTYRAYERA